MDKEEAERASELILAELKAAQRPRSKPRDRTLSRRVFVLGCAGLGTAAGMCAGLSSDSEGKFAAAGFVVGAAVGIIVAGQRGLSFAFSDPPQEPGSSSMWSKRTSGLIGMVVGGLWFLANVRHFSEQGFVAIGLPVIIFGLGAYYFFTAERES